MRVFVTGATGLVGNAVAIALKERGHEVTGLVRDQQGAAKLQAMGVTPILGEIQVAGAWREQAKQADVLVHAAFMRAGRRLGHAWVRKAAELDRTALQALVDAARTGGRCRALCYTSGISIYGDHGDAWVDETSPQRPGAIGAIKYAGEQLVKEARRSGLPAFSLRPGLVYAASGVFRDHFLNQAEASKFNFIGSGAAFHSTVHVKDLAHAYCLAIEKPPAAEVLNIVDDHPVRWSEFAKVLLGAFGGGTAKGAPPWLVALFAGKPLVEMLTASYRVRNDKIKKVLGWSPKFPALSDGIASVVAEFRNGRIRRQ